MRASERRVLVVDDKPIVREVLERYLRRDGFEVTTAVDGEDALAAFESSRPDLVVLDLMLPRIDGLEVFRRIRRHRQGTAVIMLTARGEETDRLVGLEMGADDYVAKPFSPREIVARVRAVLRRTEPGRSEDASGRRPHRPPTEIAGLRIDEDAKQVTVGGREITLTPKEFDLLSFFAANPRTAFSRNQLLEELWDLAYDGDASTVTVHIRRLREKVERDPSNPRHLVTVWGAGYRFDP